MKEKTAKALYALLKELYQSPAAKDFVDEYEREEHDRRHQRQACKPEAVKPEVGENYRDIFGNRYVVVSVLPACFGDKARIALARVSCKGEATALSDIFTPTLEEFMNPKFKKE